MTLTNREEEEIRTTSKKNMFCCTRFAAPPCHTSSLLYHFVRTSKKLIRKLTQKNMTFGDKEL